MGYIRFTSSALCAIVPQSLLKVFVQGNRFQRAILTYHSISMEPAARCVTSEQLCQQLEWTKQHYELVKLGDMVENLRGRIPSSKDQLAVTFDDGYRDFLENAVPVLLDLEVPATLFVPAAKVGGFNDWDADNRGYERKSLLTFSELSNLPEELVDIGSHGLDHRPFHTMSLKEIERQLTESRSLLEQHLGQAISLLSFPHGRHYDHEMRGTKARGKGLLQDAGYRAACTIRWGRFNSADNLDALRRVTVSSEDDLKSFQDKLAGYYDWLVPKEFCARKVRVCLRWSRKHER